MFRAKSVFQLFEIDFLFLNCSRDLDPKSFRALSFFVDILFSFVFNGSTSQSGVSFFLKFVQVGLLYSLCYRDKCKLFGLMGVRI